MFSIRPVFPWRLFISPAIVAAALFLPGMVLAQQTITVSSASALQQALDTVTDGGVVELAAGVYNAPAGGWTIDPRFGALEGHSFTLRAAAGASVTLTGGNASKILHLSTPKLVTFERLTFANGISREQYRGGGVSLARTQAHFVDCAFENNAANGPATGGGGLWIDSSTVSFERCTWKGNSSLHYGAGMSVLRSRVFVRNAEFAGNFSNPPGHSDFSTGGAIHVAASTLHVSNSRFENNQAGYVGGAIYAMGHWDDVNTDLLVTDCLFTGNFVAPKGQFGAPPTGGAIMMEAQVTARIYNSRFTNNSATQGGALSSYQTITEVQNCVFANNRATGTADPHGFGGAIIILSDDSDGTDGRTVNRRSAQLTVTDTLIHGSPNVASARQGGGIFAAGDMDSAYGVGVPKNGTHDFNRATVTLKRVVFSDLMTTDAGVGTGGAFTGDFVKFTAEDSIVANCSASHFGGAFQFIRESDVTIKNTTFSGNKAEVFGGAMAMWGGNLAVRGSKFVDNQVKSAGSAVMTTPAWASGALPAVEMTGSIENSVVSNNVGGVAAMWDIDRATPPSNRVQYSGNQVFQTGGTKFLFNDLAGALDVTKVNDLVIPHTDGTSTKKAALANVSLPSAPNEAALLMVPRQPLRSGAPRENLPLPASVAFASSGGTASLDGVPQQQRSAVLQSASGAPHTLTVGNTQIATKSTPAAALNISTRLSVGEGDNALIGGFIVVGPSPKRVLVRALGPSLPIRDALQNPSLQLFNAAGKGIAANDDWKTTRIENLLTSSQAVDIIATSAPPPSPAEAAVVVTLAPGAYTAVVRGNNNAPGVALVEVFDLDGLRTSTLANISTRGQIRTGDNVMIGGLIYGGGSADSSVVIRAIGPSLAQAGVANSLSNPLLELYNSNGSIVQSNDDWQQSVDSAAIQRVGLQPSHVKESVLFARNLPLGAYTAVVRGSDGGTGVGLVEVYVFQ